MTPHVWDLHAKVFELARAKGLREFRVNYRNAGREIVIALIMAPANDTRLAGDGRAEHPRWPMVPKLSLGQQVVYRDLLDLVKRHTTLVPGARVAVKENAKGEIVIAIIVPMKTSGAADVREAKRASRNLR
jgi:hypothetical protein